MTPFEGIVETSEPFVIVFVLDDGFVVNRWNERRGQWVSEVFRIWDWVLLLLKETGAQELFVAVDKTEHGLALALLIIRVAVLRLELLMHPVTDDLSEHQALVVRRVVRNPIPTRELHTKNKNLLENSFHPIFLFYDVFRELFHPLFDLIIVVNYLAMQILSLTEHFKFFLVCLQTVCKIVKIFEGLFCVPRSFVMYALLASFAFLNSSLFSFSRYW